MEYTKKQFHDEQELADKLDFELDFLNTVNYELAKHVCNGIGASWFPEILRDLISKLNPALVIVANNHDLGYYFGDLTNPNFKAHNAAFRENGYKVAKYKYAWYNPLRYWVMFQARKFALMCDKHGWKAYTEAIKEREADEKGMQS